ncbi:MAG: hypothetical protein JSW35_09225 [Deltaproteobacteria bacterium]|nr:MAG: hypothetical protein JSW35_09225 [Deltaproteobacteria bacterium]
MGCYLAKDLGFRAVRKSELPAEDHEQNVFIRNTLGELGQVYGLADVAFAGGSLTPIGGHNLLEPSSFGIPFLLGPHIHNFATMCRLMIKGGGCKMVTDESELPHVMLELLGNESEREKIGKRAQEFVAQNQGALDRVREILKPYLQGQ